MMKATIRDAEILKAIDPSQVASYLEMKGWHRESLIPEKASIWTFADEAGEEIAEVLLPLNPRFRDFSARMSEVLQALESIEQRSQLEIFESLVRALSDVIGIRLSHHDFDDGTIPLNDGVKLVKNAKDMLLSAACSTVDPQAYFERKKPVQANQYLKGVRFGQTERGSFILNIVSPIFPAQLPLSKSEDPFERSVVRKLCSSLEYTKNLVEEVDTTRADFKIPDDSPEYGLSSNLCEALMGIHNSGKRRGLEVNIDWSSAISISNDIPTKIIFPSKIMPSIARLGRRLRADTQKNFEFKGEVLRLERQRRDSTGRVTLSGEIDGKIRKVKVELSEHAYRIASIANQERELISCRGTLLKEGKSFTLLNPIGFTIDPESSQSNRDSSDSSIQISMDEES